MRQTRSYLRPEKVLRKRRKKVWKRFFLYIFLFVIFICALSIISNLKALSIKDIKVANAVITSQSDIELMVRNKIDGSYLYLFSRKNVFLYPRSSVESEILAQYPRILSVQIKTDGLNALVVNVVERKPEYTWCDVGQSVFNTVDTVSGSPDVAFEGNTDKCYFMDINGLIYDDALSFEGDSYLTFTGGINSDNPINKNILSKKDFTDLITFITNLKNSGYEISQVNIREDGDYELALKDNGLILVSKKLSFDDTVLNISTAFSTSPLKVSTTSPLMKFDYVDMRFGNKVFYKLKTTSTSSATTTKASVASTTTATSTH